VAPDGHLSQPRRPVAPDRSAVRVPRPAARPRPSAPPSPGVDGLARRRAGLALLAYLLFVVYGSLVPLDYRPLPLDQAIEQFQHVRYLDLGVVSRADWIANILLYVPLAFLGCVALLGLRGAGPTALPGMAVVLAACLAVAMAVEFAQQWFAPRTVSLNDLIAETIGSLAGVLLWAGGGPRVAGLLSEFLRGGRASVVSVMGAYAGLYLALALFPFDFVISGEELRWNLESGRHGWLVAPVCGGLVRCTARLAVEVVGLVPLGVLATLAFPGLRLRRLFLAGLALGLVLEPLQLLLASGTAQGASILLRGLGLAAGRLVGERLRRLGPPPLARFVVKATPLLVLPYLTGIAAVAGWLSTSALSPGEGLARLGEVRWLPFYYHYFTSEAAAVGSTLAHIALYAPFGVVAWAWGRSGGLGGVSRLGPGAAALGAAAVALIIEGGKLFFPPEHPDPTNLLIAAFGAAAAFALARWLERVVTGRDRAAPAPLAPPYPAVDGMRAPGPGPAVRPPAAPHPVAAPSAAEAPGWPAPEPLGLAMASALTVPLGAGVLAFPLGRPVLLAVLLAYGALLWVRPLAWLAVLPALLPVLDLSETTGRLSLDAFDLLVLVTVAVGYARLLGLRPRPWPGRWLLLGWALLWLSWAIASARGLWPLLGADWPPPASSHSPLEAWMVGKGLLWALLLVPLLRRVPAARLAEARRLVLLGTLAGLLAVALWVLWERHVFVGVASFENVFRVTGPFASMHTGGAYIEAFLAFAFPVLAVWVLMQEGWGARLLGLAAVALTSYAMLVTFSRGGYGALVAGLLVVAVGGARLRSVSAAARWTALGGLAVAVVAVAVPVLSGEFAQYRLGRSAEDLATRERHWARALGLMDDGPVAALAGLGFGQYPVRYLLGVADGRTPATYAVLREAENPYLRLGSGEAAFVDQFAEIEPGGLYTVSVRVRPRPGGAPLRVALCEKALLYSFECVWRELAPGTPGAGWSRATVAVQSGPLGRGGHWPHRPVKLSLYNPGAGAPVDVDDVSLRAADGRELLVNGDFSRGLERWLFVTDQDLAWHIHQQWVETYFAQGLLGVLAVLVLLVGVARVIGPAALAGDPWATALAGALVAFLSVGLLGSTLDTARLAMLFYVGALAAGLLTHRERRQT
jgi:VanZ family protein